MSGRCNGISECRDNTDEQDCDSKFDYIATKQMCLVCSADNFYCKKSNKCVPAAERCDGVNQCAHGEDEQLCKKSNSQMYMCENRQTQVPNGLVCDGKSDCPGNAFLKCSQHQILDGSDEKYCLHQPTPPLTNEKSIEENVVSENTDPTSVPQAIPDAQNTAVGTELVPNPISSDKTPPGTGKLPNSASFPRIRFNGHSEEETASDNKDGRQRAEMTEGTPINLCC